MIFGFGEEKMFLYLVYTWSSGLECVLKFAKSGANIISFSRDEKKIKNLIRN